MALVVLVVVILLQFLPLLLGFIFPRHSLIGMLGRSLLSSSTSLNTRRRFRGLPAGVWSSLCRLGAGAHRVSSSAVGKFTPSMPARSPGTSRCLHCRREAHSEHAGSLLVGCLSIPHPSCLPPSARTRRSSRGSCCCREAQSERAGSLPARIVLLRRVGRGWPGGWRG